MAVSISYLSSNVQGGYNYIECTISASANTYIIVVVFWGASGDNTVYSLTVDGHDASLLKEASDVNNAGVSVWGYWTSSALSGVTVHASLNASLDAAICAFEATGTDADSGTSIGVNESAGIASPEALAVTTTANGSVPFAAFTNFGSSGTAGANTVYVGPAGRLTSGVGDYFDTFYNNESTTSGNSYTCTASISDAVWTGVCVEIKPAAGGGPSTYDNSIEESITEVEGFEVYGPFGPPASMGQSNAFQSNAFQIIAAAENKTIAETVSATESLSVALAILRTVAETLASTDSVAPALTIRSSLAEVSAGTDSLAPALVLGGSLTETVTATDSYSPSETDSSTQAETLSSTESLFYSRFLITSITETGPPTEALDVSETAGATIAESVSLTDSVDSTKISGGQTHNDSLTETSSAIDSLASALISDQSLIESLTISSVQDSSTLESSSLAETTSVKPIVIHLNHTASRKTPPASYSVPITTTGPSLIVISIGWGCPASTTVASVTVDGLAARRQDGIEISLAANSWQGSEIWTFWSAGPLNNVTVAATLTSGGAVIDAALRVSEVTGVDENSPGVHTTDSGTSSTSEQVSLTATANRSLIFGSFTNFQGSATPGADTTELSDIDDGYLDFYQTAFNNQTTSLGVSYTVVETIPSGSWTGVGLELRPAEISHSIGLRFGQSLGENNTATDSLAALSSSGETETESVSAAESYSIANLETGTQTETSSATETLGASALWTSSLAESLSTADVYNSTHFKGARITETISAGRVYIYDERHNFLNGQGRYVAVTMPDIPAGAVVLVLCSANWGPPDISTCGSASLTFTKQVSYLPSNQRQVDIFTAVAGSDLANETITYDQGYAGCFSPAITVIVLKNADTSYLTNTATNNGISNSFNVTISGTRAGSLIFAVVQEQSDHSTVTPDQNSVEISDQAYIHLPDHDGNANWAGRAKNWTAAGSAVTVGGTFDQAGSLYWAAAAIEIGSADQAAAPDYLNSNEVIEATLSETLSAADSLAVSNTLQKSINEIVTSIDSLLAVESFAIDFSETLSATDVYGSAPEGLNNGFTETVSATDAFAPLLIIRAIEAETVSANDAVSHTALLEGSLNERGPTIEAVVQSPPGGSGQTTAIATLSTFGSGRLVVILACNDTYSTQPAPLVSVTGSTLGSFTKIVSTDNVNYQSAEVWAKWAPSQLTDEQITVVRGGVPAGNFVVDALSIIGTKDGSSDVTVCFGDKQAVDHGEPPGAPSDDPYLTFTPQRTGSLLLGTFCDGINATTVDSLRSDTVRLTSDFQGLEGWYWHIRSENRTTNTSPVTIGLNITPNTSYWVGAGVEVLSEDISTDAYVSSVGASFSETQSATDLYDSTRIPGGQTLNDSFSESLTATDTATSSSQKTNTFAESSSEIDSLDYVGIWQNSSSETVSATDAQTSNKAASSGFSESSSESDSYTSAAPGESAYAETASAVDVFNSALVTLNSESESSSAIDSYSATTLEPASFTESASVGGGAGAPNILSTTNKVASTPNTVTVPTIPDGAVVVFLFRDNQGQTPSVSSPNLTWAQRAYSGTTNSFSTIYTAVNNSGSSLTDEIISYHNLGVATTAVSAIVLTNANTSALSNVIQTTGTGTTRIATINAVGTQSYVFAGFSFNAGSEESITPDAGTTTIDNPGGLNWAVLYAARNTDPGSGTITVSGSGGLNLDTYYITAIEIQGLGVPDTLVPSLSIPATLSETASTTEAYENASIEFCTLLEVVTATDSLVRTGSGTSLLTETTNVGVVDAFTVGQIIGASLSEITSATEAQSSTVVKANTFSETVSSTETIDQRGVWSERIVESVNAGEVSVGLLSGQMSALDEVVSATDVLSTTENMFIGIAETVSAIDSSICSSILRASETESVSSTDAFAVAELIVRSIVETLSATDALNIGNTLNQSLSEFTSLTDAFNFTLLPGSSITETIAATDSTAARAIAGVTFVESVSSTDTVNGILPGAGGSIIETTDVSDVLAVSETASTSITEIASGTEALASGNIIPVSESETVSSAVSVEVSEADQSAVAETVSASETLNLALILSRALAENVLASDSLAFRIQSSASIAETASATDALSANEISGTAFTESASATDSLNGTVSGIGPSFFEQVSLTDSLGASEVASIGIAETVAPTDSLAQGKAQSGTESESASATDTLSSLGIWSAAISETASAADSYFSLLPGQQVFAESVSATDVLDENAKWAASLTEAISSTEILAVGIRVGRSLAETSASTETLARGIAGNRTIAETVSATDAVAANERAGDTSLTETISSTESLSVALRQPISFSESIALTDQLYSSLQGLSVTETVSATTAQTSTASKSNDFSESVAPAETLAIQLRQASSFAESVSATVDVDHQELDRDSVSESVSATDSLALSFSKSSSIVESASADDALSTIEFLGATYIEDIDATSVVGYGTGQNTSISEDVYADVLYRVPAGVERALQESTSLADYWQYTIEHIVPSVPIPKDISVLGQPPGQISGRAVNLDPAATPKPAPVIKGVSVSGQPPGQLSGKARNISAPTPPKAGPSGGRAKIINDEEGT